MTNNLDRFKCMITITNELKNFTKIQDFLKKLDLYGLIKNHNFFIAGGFFTSLFSDVKINDLDLFFHSEIDCLEAISYLKENKSTLNIEIFENLMVCNIYKNDIKIQIIKKYFFKTPEEIFKHFDFTIVKFCCNHLFTYHHERFFEDLLLKRLVMDNDILVKPFSTLSRTYKYVGRGFKICPVGIRKIVENVQNHKKIDFDNPDSNEIEFYPDGTMKFNGLD